MLVSKIKGCFRSAAFRVALAAIVAAGPCVAMPSGAQAQAGTGKITATLYMEQERGYMADYYTVTVTKGTFTQSKNFVGDSISGYVVFTNLPPGLYTVTITDYAVNQVYSSMSSCGGGVYHSTSGVRTVTAGGNASCHVNVVYSDYGPPAE